jgi:hypothetical protein
VVKLGDVQVLAEVHRWENVVGHWHEGHHLGDEGWAEAAAEGGVTLDMVIQK